MMRRFVHYIFIVIILCISQGMCFKQNDTKVVYQFANEFKNKNNEGGLPHSVAEILNRGVLVVCTVKDDANPLFLMAVSITGQKNIRSSILIILSLAGLAESMADSIRISLPLRFSMED